MRNTNAISATNCKTSTRLTPAEAIMALDPLENGDVVLNLPVSLSLENWLWFKTSAARSGESLSDFASRILSRVNYGDYENKTGAISN